MQALQFQVDYELWALLKFALNVDRPSHLLNNLLADREAEACAWLIPPLVLSKPTEIYEQFLDPLLRHTDARVHNAEADRDIALDRRDCLLISDL